MSYNSYNTMTTPDSPGATPARPPRRHPLGQRPLFPVHVPAKSSGSSGYPASAMYTLDEWQEDEEAAREARSRSLEARMNAAQAREKAGAAWEHRLSMSSHGSRRGSMSGKRSSVGRHSDFHADQYEHEHEHEHPHLHRSSWRSHSSSFSLDLASLPSKLLPHNSHSDGESDTSSYPPTPSSPPSRSAASSYPPTPTASCPGSPLLPTPTLPALDVDEEGPLSPELTPPITPRLATGLSTPQTTPTPGKSKSGKSKSDLFPAPPRPPRAPRRETSGPVRPPRRDRSDSGHVPVGNPKAQESHPPTVTITTPAMPNGRTYPTPAEAVEVARLKVANAVLKARIAELHARIVIMEERRGGVDDGVDIGITSNANAATSMNTLEEREDESQDVTPRAPTHTYPAPNRPDSNPSATRKSPFPTHARATSLASVSGLSLADEFATKHLRFSRDMYAPAYADPQGSAPRGADGAAYPPLEGFVMAAPGRQHQQAQAVPCAISTATPTGAAAAPPSQGTSVSSLAPGSPPTSHRASLSFTPTPLSSVPASPYAASFSSATTSGTGGTGASCGTFGRSYGLASGATVPGPGAATWVTASDRASASASTSASASSTTNDGPGRSEEHDVALRKLQGQEEGAEKGGYAWAWNRVRG